MMRMLTRTLPRTMCPDGGPWKARVAAGALALLVPMAHVLAQATPAAPAPLKPPTPGAPDSPPVVLNILIAAVVIVVILGAAMFPSRRGHQD